MIAKTSLRMFLPIKYPANAGLEKCLITLEIVNVAWLVVLS
jgi:hypothetical protein